MWTYISNTPSRVPLTVSLISHATNHCLTAQANMSSGPIIVQNIISSRPHNPFQNPEGGTFGWTDTHAQMIIVEMQFQVMLKSVRFAGHLHTIPGSALSESSIIAWAGMSRKKRTMYWGNIMKGWELGFKWGSLLYLLFDSASLRLILSFLFTDISWTTPALSSCGACRSSDDLSSESF